MRIVLARHGETEWSASGKHTSTTDISLTERGRAAALGLRERLSGREFALVLASPRVRARETAALAGFDPEIEPGLAEVDYGDYEGRTTAEIREDRPGWSLWTDGSPGGETMAEAGARADRVIARALASNPKVLLLDEPTEGIQPSIIKDLAQQLKKIRDERGLTIIVSEQVLSFALAVADRIAVMVRGALVHEAPRADLNEASLGKLLAI